MELWGPHVISKDSSTILMAAGRLLFAVAASLQCVYCVTDHGCANTYPLDPEYLGYRYEVLVWPPGTQQDSEVSFSVEATGRNNSQKMR